MPELEDKFIHALIDGLKESYPSVTKEIIEEQISKIKNGMLPSNVIGLWILDDVKKFYKLK